VDACGADERFVRRGQRPGIEPINLIPDFVPVMGFADNLLIVA
jgi:hypothetical protein